MSPNGNGVHPQLLDPAVIGRIELLKLTARRVAEGVLTGLHRSTHRGSSVEFAEHKPYSPGDDARLIDWKVFAKSDRYTIKQFEDETNIRAIVVLDATASMEYGSVGSTKLFYGAQLLASLGYLLIRQRDAVGMAALREGISHYLPPRCRVSHLNVMIEELARLEPVGPTALPRVLRTLAEKVGRKAFIIVASDLFDNASETQRAMRLLAGRRHEVAVFHLWDPEELKFPFDHQTQFEDMEGPVKLAVDPKGIREEYLKQVGLFMDGWRRGCLESRIDYTPVNIAEPLEDVLHRYLASRSERRGAARSAPSISQSVRGSR